MQRLTVTFILHSVSDRDDERVDAAVGGYQSHGGAVETTEDVFVIENLRIGMNGRKKTE